MVAYAFNPSMREVDAQCVLGQPGLDSETNPASIPANACCSGAHLD